MKLTSEIYKAYVNPGGGGGGTVLRFGSDGGVPLKPPNQYLSLRVILAEKGTYRVFSQENDVFVYFSDEMGEITKVGGMFRDFQLKTIPYV